MARLRTSIMSSFLRIGALLDFEWGPDIFNLTIDMLNDHHDGMWDDFLDNETFIDRISRNDSCIEAKAVDKYWNEVRTHWRPYAQLPHAVIGCHCSGASSVLARAAGLDNVPVVSMSATSFQLSDPDDFKNFFRTIAPDDHRGQVGALVALFRSFGWDRVSVIGTNTPYSRDMATKFEAAWVGYHSATREGGGNEWTGSIAYSPTISLNDAEEVDDASVERALLNVPNDPLVNSRVVLLIATASHASRILELAIEKQFQPEAIWIASDGWVGNREDFPALPKIPGSLGLTPFHDRDSLTYTTFLGRYNEVLMSRGNRTQELTMLPMYAAETIDAILAVVLALADLSLIERNNGTSVRSKLLHINFTGVGGRVAFDYNGRFREKPRYELQNVKQGRWQVLPGIITNITANVTVANICWPQPFGCYRESGPNDKYGVPVAVWIYIVFPIIALLLALIAGLLIKYFLDRKNMKEMKEKLKAIDNIDEQLANIDDQVDDAKKRQNILLRKREELQDTPDTWSASSDILVEVLPEDDQYWNVARELRQSMVDAWISKVWRVQNKPLWNYYSFHKNRLAMNGIDDNELAVWHGTSLLEPSIIYTDTQDGFMMQCSRQGLWGRGLYFATKSSYSDSYSYTPDEEETQHGDEREMFLAKLLVGNAVEMNRDESPAKAADCKSLTRPPINPDTGLKFNTVTGWTGGSHVWVVYENGRAYPDYLVRYYKGERDPNRTPYESKEDLPRSAPSPVRQRGSFLTNMRTTLSTIDRTTVRPLVRKSFVWEFEDDGWHPLAPQTQAIVESAYLAFESGASPASTQMYMAGAWTYEVDFHAMMQTNVDHSGHRQRRVRRREVDADIAV